MDLWQFLPGPRAVAPAKGRACYLPYNDDVIAVDDRQPGQEMNGGSSTHRELKRQISAMKAVSEMDVEHLLTKLRLVRSYFNEEQLQKPALEFFRENLPNVSLVRNDEDEHFNMRWKDDDGNLSMYDPSGRDIHASLFQHISMAYPSCSNARPSFGGFQFSGKATQSLPGVDDLQMGKYLSQESLNNMMVGMPEGFQTPGAESQRLSLGMTPKTRRLPKHGEMLLSVHGSPLGVYKEDNMEAIRESEEG